MIISHYQAPWYYILFVLLILTLIGYGYFIHPDVQVLMYLQQQKFTLQESIKSFSKQISIPSIHQFDLPQFHARPTYSVPATFAILAQTYGLIIKNINLNYVPKSEVSNEQIELQLLAEANYQQLGQFFSALALQTFIPVVTDFDITVNKNDHLRIILHIIMNPNQSFLIPVMKSSATFANIFCSSKSFTQSAINDFNELQTMPISSMKYKGYLKLGDHLSAMMLLANQHIQLIERGSVFGRERVRAQEINNESMLIALPDGKTVTLQID